MQGNKRRAQGIELDVRDPRASGRGLAGSLRPTVAEVLRSCGSAPAFQALRCQRVSTRRCCERPLVDRGGTAESLWAGGVNFWGQVQVGKLENDLGWGDGGHPKAASSLKFENNSKC